MGVVAQVEIGLLLLLAAFLSAIIGVNRERIEHPAGLRTHMLVGIGACLFTLISIHAFDEGDPGRIASQIVVGIGFLGAGAILKENNQITGLTTAASLWATAAIGMAVGTGMWFLAALVTLLLWVVLVFIRWLEMHVLNTKDEMSR